jgi:hypothetical protein
MQRESDKHGPREDDELALQTEGLVQGNRPARSEESRMPEPGADDDPVVPGYNADLNEPLDEGDEAEEG